MSFYNNGVPNGAIPPQAPNGTLPPQAPNPLDSLTDAQRAILTKQFDAYNATPQDLISRYQTINDSSSPDWFKQRVGSLFGDQDKLNNTAYQTATQMLGRNVTQQEFSQILPAFAGPNGQMAGRAALANLVNQYKINPGSDPSNPKSPIYDPGIGGGKNGEPPPAAPDYGKQINDAYQNTLKRAPTADELAHFTDALKTGQTDAYGLGDILKNTTEYQNAADKQFRGDVSGELQGYDQKFFDRGKQDIMATYARNGQALGTSPSLDYALTDMLGKLADNRGAWLSQLSSQQYGGNKAAAAGQYGANLQNMQGNYQSQVNRGNALTDYYNQRGFQGADYNSQRNDFMNYMNGQRGNGSPWAGIAGGVIGAGAGAMLAGPMGATAGWQIGQGVGNGFNYLR